MDSILAGARKYRLGLVLAHQEIRQIKNEEVTSTVMANPYTRVCFRLGDQDAAKVEGGFAFFDARDLQNLGTGEAICRIERADFDFNLTTPPMPPVDPAVALERIRLITQLSRQRYGASREKVVEELRREAARTNEAPEPETPKKRTGKKTATAEPKPSEEDASSAPDDSGKGEEPDDPETESSGEPPEPEPKPPPGPPRPPAPEPPSAPSPPPMTETAPPFGASPSPAAEVEVKEDKPKPKRPAAATAGRGGPDHKYLQQLIKLRAEGMGWKANIEKPILGGAGSIDIALEKEGHTVACEICVTSPVEQEVGNIEKCLKAGLTRIVSVSQDRKQLARIRAAAEKAFSVKELEKVQFLNPDELFELIEGMNARFATKEKRTRGYNVVSKFTSMDQGEKKAMQQTLGETMVGSVDELQAQQEAQKRRDAGKPKAPRKRKAKDDPKE